MSIDQKYRVHEVAKDFGLQTKEITEILTDYCTTPKNHMQVLSDRELSIIFEYVTQHRQIASLAEVFAEGAQPGEKKAAEKSTEKTSEKPAKGTSAQNKSAQGQKSAKGAQQQSQKSAEKKPDASAENRPQTRVPQKKVVDTRKAANVNLDRYDQHLEELAPDRADRMQQGKQKIKQQSRNRQQQQKQSSKRRQEEQARQMRRLQLEIAKKAPVKVQIPDEISVGELASRMKKTAAEVVKTLMKNGFMTSVSDVIDFDTASLIAEEMGCVVEREVIVTIEERLIDDRADREDELENRAPVVVVMGHVDHGKTSLLDYIRNSNVAAGEAGGITQAIGAYQVSVGEHVITFLDTPGHEAFTAMRARGAMVTDLAILVVAADDGIMPQTVEAINHAKAAEIPIIVAINKMDKVGANPDRIMQQLTEYELVAEDWGGDTIICPISAKTGDGIDNLLDMMVLTAEMRELKANPNRTAKGAVIEARLEKGRGSVATVLVQNGTLKQGDIIIAGTAVGRVRAMNAYRGNRLKSAGPSVPVEIIGLSEVPEAGDDFYVVSDERMARELAEQRRQEKKDAMSRPAAAKVSLDDLFSQLREGEMKTLNIIVKADVQGSAEAVRASLEKLTNEEVNVRVIHCAVGGINESDVMLASTSGAIIVGFNVRPDAQAKIAAERDKVDMRMYRVIYECIEEIEAAMKGMLDPKYKEVDLGKVEVRQIYKITGVGIVAGSYVLEGKVTRHAKLRLVRDGIVIHEGEVASLQRFKDSVKEVATGYECGITLEKFSDLKVGDVLECFEMQEIAR